MQGTFYNRNIFDRLGDAVRAFKALPSPAQLYPPSQQGGGGPHWISWQGWSALEAAQGGKDEQRAKTAVQSPWVFADINAIANEFSASELIIKEADGDVDDHPLEVLWQAPNPHMGRSFLMKYWAWSYTLVGKAYLYWLPTKDGIAELWPIPPFMIRPVPSPTDFISGYAFKAREDMQPIMIPAEYVTYSHSVNLFDIRDGLSFLVAAMTGIESDLAMERWNRNFFEEHNGVPDGLITVGKDTLDSDLTRIRQELRDFFGGTRRGVAVARSGDMDYKPFGRSQKEVEFKEGIELASKVIGRTLGFPDGYWSETANRANAEQARATMIAGAVWPLLVGLAEDLNAGPIPRFYGDQFRASFKDIRPEDRALKLQELQFYAQIETVNELRKRIGTDELKDPRGEMLIAEITKGTPLPATPAAEETEEYLQEQEAEAGVGEEEAMPEEAGALPPEGGEALPMEGEEEAPIVPEEAALPTKAVDLANWERKALKALKRFHAADCRFQSDSIPLPEQERIHEALKAAETVEDVREAFKQTYPIKFLDPNTGGVVEQWDPQAVKSSRRVTVAQLAGDVKTADADDLVETEWESAMKWAKRINAE